MGQMTKKWDKILELFYEYSSKEFRVREIAKKTRIPKSTVQRYLLILKKENLITNDNKATNSDFFKIKKTNYFIEKIFGSGLIDYLKKGLNPSCIILFGSFRKGESEKESDIDLFIATHHKKEVNLTKFEKILGHKVQLFVEKDILSFSKGRLINNIINGIKLYGSFVIYK